MKFKHLLLVVLLLGIGTVLAKEVWKKKPYVEWTQQEAVALLTDSPWAVNQPVRGASARLAQSSSAPREGSGTCEEATIGNMEAGAEEAVAQTAASASALSTGPRFYTVRFVSARPVREAIARWAVLNGRILPSQAQTMLTQDPYNGSIVVSMSASNDADWSELNNFSTQALEEANYLLLKKSKRKIFAERYVPPVESGIGEALFYFARTDGGVTLIASAEKEVAFSCRLSSRTQFRTEFKLKEMMINGELAI